MERLSNSLKVRKDYSKIKSVDIIPSLIEMQKKSYDHFLLPDNKNTKNQGLYSVFKAFFPILSDDGRFVLEFVDYFFEENRHTQEEIKYRSGTYDISLKLKLRLITNEIDKETGEVSVKDIKEQDIFLSNFPLMTENGTFIINGTERVIVSQIYRSPGIFFDTDKGKTVIGKELFSASVIPYVGSWLDIEIDAKDLLYVKIDKRKKIPLVYFLKSLDSENTAKLQIKAEKEGKILNSDLLSGMSNAEILSQFYKPTLVKISNNRYTVDFNPSDYANRVLSYDLIDAATGNVILEKSKNITKGVLKKLEKEKVSQILIPEEELLNSYLYNDLVIKENEIVIGAGEKITEDFLTLIKDNNINQINAIIIDDYYNSNYIINSLMVDKEADYLKSLNEIYKTVKLSEALNKEVGRDFLMSLFFSNERYDLSHIGRMKINEKFNLSDSHEKNVLCREDIFNIINYLIEIKVGKKSTDDIDHLGNRRVRSVGELIENEVRTVLVRMERFIKEKMASSENAMPSDLINVKAVQTVVKDFFGTSQLSQFMDQTNPLSEITHKRRLSALGPKGLTRERASFEVRDVHLTHYGRICPIETPEGPNIGLINSLSVYAKVNEYGFLETPYRKVENGKVTDEIVYMTASQETDHVIAQASSTLGKKGEFVDALVRCRINGELNLCPPERVTYIDVSPKQLVSVAASLIPFLENDDANRALMGANMQRQAVPLLKSEAPFVGTGMEELVAKNSGAVVLAKRAGIVKKVDSNQIVIKLESDDHSFGEEDIYKLKKFQRSNHNTCVNQKPIVNVGDVIKQGDIIADGQSVDNGELALGKNVLVGFMPWNGYNFEDSILISERIVREDVFTSIHIEEFEVVARDTKLGPEEITSDIPNVNEESIRHLDESGIVYVGAEVYPGDILVGKVTPKAESVISPEEKLLRAIFGEKSTDVKDTSFKVPSGIQGTVVDVRVFSRRGLEKDDRTMLIERSLIESYSKEKEEQIASASASYIKILCNLLIDQEVVSGKSFTKGEKIDKSKLVKLRISDMFEIVVKSKKITDQVAQLAKEFKEIIEIANKKLDLKISNLQKGDDLPSGSLKVIKVFIAVKRKLQPGDKMAGRHGNKGVVSKILPIEDMPYLEDGTPLDICLNPLGVPSRMNVGQILEVHLGWAAANVGKKVSKMLEEYKSAKKQISDIREYLEGAYLEDKTIDIKSFSDEEVLLFAKKIRKAMPVATSVFDGVKETDINRLLEYNNLDTSAQSSLIDGRTGDFFERKVTVGYIYMLKLHHLVDEKIHARSTGPYSLITQQPLGGKAQFGGQRVGEMEVWALEAYGASYILREMLTVKSDDQVGRTLVYESIIKGENSFETGVPESFNVLIKELRSLCLNLELKD